MGEPGYMATDHRHGSRWRRVRRFGSILAAGLFAAALTTGCDSPAGAPEGLHVEAWQADVSARFTFPPVGLEEFALARKEPGSLELVIYLDADGALERLAAERVQGFEADALETLFDAIRHARFAPAEVDGRPVPSIKRIALDIDPLADRFLATYGPPDQSR